MEKYYIKDPKNKISNGIGDVDDIESMIDSVEIPSNAKRNDSLEENGFDPKLFNIKKQQSNDKIPQK
jgi:hypothetical protein